MGVIITARGTQRSGNLPGNWRAWARRVFSTKPLLHLHEESKKQQKNATDLYLGDTLTCFRQAERQAAADLPYILKVPRWSSSQSKSCLHPYVHTPKHIARTLELWQMYCWFPLSRKTVPNLCCLRLCLPYRLVRPWFVSSWRSAMPLCVPPPCAHQWHDVEPFGKSARSNVHSWWRPHAKGKQNGDPPIKTMRHSDASTRCFCLDDIKYARLNKQQSEKRVVWVWKINIIKSSVRGRPLFFPKTSVKTQIEQFLLWKNQNCYNFVEFIFKYYFYEVPILVRVSQFRKV